jgi:hypothetical protein
VGVAVKHQQLACQVRPQAVALESAPLTWLESLKPNSIDSWEDQKRAFIDNFQGSMIRAGTHLDLSQVKQVLNETLRSYTHRFFEMRATIANITDEDIIRYFRNSLFSKHLPQFWMQPLDYCRGAT